MSNLLNKLSKNHYLIDGKLWKMRKLIKRPTPVNFSKIKIFIQRAPPLAKNRIFMNYLWSFLLKTKGITVNLSILNPLPFDQYKVFPILKNFFVANTLNSQSFFENMDFKKKKSLFFINKSKEKEFLILKYKLFSAQEALNLNSGSIYSLNLKCKKGVILSTW